MLEGWGLRGGLLLLLVLLEMRCLAGSHEGEDLVYRGLQIASGERKART